MTGQHSHTSAASAVTVRGAELLRTANDQIDTLIDLLSQRGEAALSRPCPGRENMDDGTIAAVARHTAERYQLIAEFVRTAGDAPGVGLGHQPSQRHDFRHGPGGGAGPSHSDSLGGVDRDALLERLSVARGGLGRLALLSDQQLDAIPPTGSFRFCDGQRNLAQVIASLLKHQGHQVEAVVAAVSDDGAHR